MAKLIEITGKVLSGEWGTDDESGNGIPVLRTTNFTNEGIVDYSNVVTRTIQKKNIDAKYLRKGDIIIEKSGGSDKQPVGRVIYFDGPESTYLFNNFTGLLRVKNQAVWLPRYVFYSLFHNYRKGGTRPFESKTTGLHNLKTDDYISRYEVLEAPISEQQSICKQLDYVYDIIKTRQQQLQKLDELVKARFVEMFGGIHDSSLYPYVPVKELTHVISGGTPSRDVLEYWCDGTIPWVKTTELQNKIITEVDEHITSKGLAASSAKIVPPNTTLIAMYGQGKTRGMTGYLGISASTNQACACILPSPEINSVYIWKYFELSYDKLRNMAKGGNQPNLNGNMIKNFPVLVPQIKRQEEYVQFVNQVDKSKVAVQKSLDEAQLLFDSLMQHYFG